MEVIQQLQRKEGLDAGDATTLLQFLQEQTTPILSLRNVGVTFPTPAVSRQQSSELSGSFERRQQSPSSSVMSGTVPKTEEKGGQVSVRRTQGSVILNIASIEETEPSVVQSRGKDCSGKSKSFNLSSFEEFPPMGMTRSTSGRRRGKASSNPPRRITLTPVDSQPSSSHFSSGTAASTWKSNPAFTSTFSSSESPLSLSEERRLLQQERSKRRHRPVSSTTGGREQRSWSHHSVSRPVYNDCSVRSPNSLTRGKSIHAYSSDMSADSTPLEQEGESLQESPTSAMFPVTTPLTSTPLTSTPLTSTPVLTSQLQLQVSQRRVTTTDRKALDGIADIYARLISDHLVANITSEIHFIIQLVTTPALVPPATAGLKLVDGSVGLFGTADNCVYFAVAVLNRIRYIAASLDNATLRLLAENTRIATFHPELASFFAEKVSEEPPSYHNLPQEGRHFGVPFQEDTDNSKNFPNIKAFHAFKKQRDSFYSVLRDWEKCHNNPDWNMQAALGERIRSLVRLPSELCSHAHFARLFQKQLTESCRYPLDPPAMEEGSSLAGHLRKMDPTRLMRLNKRFLHPSTGCGPCPPPSFSHVEEFFSGFILATDSYVFIHHLMATLYAEVLKLHSSCCSVQPRDLPDLVHTMRALTKFLGFLEFLPHRKPVSESLLSSREVMQPFNILRCVLEAGERGHLCVTVPWVVEYLSMMDPQAAAVEHHRTLLHTLMDIYRSVSLSTREKKGKAPNRGLFLIATTLGWLFEIPSTPTGTFFEHIRTSSGPTVKVADDPECLDSQDIVTSELLYACCPFLGELRSMLAEFAVGLQSKASPIRKIKPISADVDHSETTTPAKQLQLQLQENFFRSHPPYLKQLCDINSERIAASAVAHCEASILPQHVSYAVRALSEWLKEKYNASSRSVDGGQTEGWEPFSKGEAERTLMQLTTEAIHRGSETAKSFFSSYCQSQAQKSLEVLLTGMLADQVTAVAGNITAEWASEKCSKWIADKFRAAVQLEVYRGFEKLRRTFREPLRSGAVSLQTQSLSLSNPVQEAGSRESGLSCHAEGSRAHALAMQSSPVGSQDSSRSHSSVGAAADSLVLDSSALEEFKTAAKAVVQTQAPTTEQLAKLQKAVDALAEFICSTTSLLPGVHIPQLLPCGLEHTLTLSVELAAYLVAHRSLALPQDSNKSSICGPICAVHLLESLLRTWKLMKCLKLEIPVRGLMSPAAFRRYTQQDTRTSIVETTVWQSLGDVLIGLVLCDVTPSPVVESLWLCRKQQLPPSEVHWLMRAAAIFLDTWYTYTPPEGDTLFGESSVHLREVHFVRLLCTILQDLDKTDLPASLIAHSQLKEIVHPF